MSTKAWVAAVFVVALAGGGYAALRYTGRLGSPACGCCQAGDPSPGGSTEPGSSPAAQPPPDDKQLAAAQGLCPVMPDTKLGEMGEPIKLMVRGRDGKEEPVFVCCKGCKRKVLANPDKTLAKVAELKAAPK